MGGVIVMNELDYPKDEDVEIITIGHSHAIGVVKLTDENRPHMVKVALSMYLGEKCKYCLKEYTTLEELKGAVFAGYHEYGRLACDTCWKENN